MKFVTLYDSKAFIPEEKGRPLALTSWLKATLLLCCEKTKSPIVKEVSRSSTAAGKSLWRPPFTSTVVPTFPLVVAAFYENSSSPTTVYYLRFSCGVSRALFASLLVLFFAKDLLRRRVCRKKGEEGCYMAKWHLILTSHEATMKGKMGAESIQHQVSRLPGCSKQFRMCFRTAMTPNFFHNT